MNRTAASWTKQCSHCLRLLGEDGRFRDSGLPGRAGGFQAGDRVFPCICPECFGALREGLRSGRPAGPGLAVA